MISENKKTDSSRVLTVGEVAKRSGVPVSTLHFYEGERADKKYKNQW